ncbi:MAG: 3-deoxy-8-phosphooctulonate synthase [Thermodesulfovibrio sp.]|nr:3-deoxy-8-phosphooctulonate synthase [Thermodesulfovibrio sp.]MDW7972408.1 3-deoxy-8-phosphooctulonate synthase [Thermodesulfovibrio sp.]
MIFSVGNTQIKKDELFIIAGPCVIENEDVLFKTAYELKEISQNLNIPFIFKSSYDKANRSSIKSYRGPGIKKGLEILSKIKEEFDLPILSDVHSVEEIRIAKDFLDIIQIPAFLCRQTDLVVEAGKTGKPVNVKKGQFLAPWDVKNIVEKIKYTGNEKIIITERGTSFGYNNLVVDFRSFPIIRSMGVLVVFDATHSVQLPGGGGTCSSGQREFIPYLSRAAVACGIDGLFFEVHPDPDKALCDGPNMLALKDFKKLITELLEIHKTVKKHN